MKNTYHKWRARVWRQRMDDHMSGDGGHHTSSIISPRHAHARRKFNYHIGKTDFTGHNPYEEDQ